MIATTCSQGTGEGQGDKTAPRQITGVLGAWWSVLSSPGLALPAGVIAVNAVLIVHATLTTLERYPHSADEYAYLIQAELFSRGRLSTTSPQPPEFFNLEHVINNGRFFSKYPPGWPLLLGAVWASGIPWLLNPLLGIASLVVLYVTARKHFSVQAANVLLLLLQGNPFIVLNSASYFSHPACLLSVALAAHAFFCWMDDPGAKAGAFGFAAASGFAFLVRPFTAVVLTLPFAAVLVTRLAKRSASRPSLASIACAFAPAAACVLVFLAYNLAQTGDPFLQPFTLYDPQDTPRWPDSLATYITWARQFLAIRLWVLNFWMPLSMGLVGLALFRQETRANVKVRLLLAGFAILAVAFSFYPTDGGNRYGPRYLYETVAALALAGAASVATLPRLSLPIVILVLGMNVWGLCQESRSASETIREKRLPYDLARAQHLDRAVVFLKTGSGAAAVSDLTRNGIDFNAPVLYALDLGDRNWELVEELGQRTPYVFEYDSQLGRGTLTRLRR